MNRRIHTLELPLVLCLALGPALALLPATARAQGDGADPAAARTTPATPTSTGPAP